MLQNKTLIKLSIFISVLYNRLVHIAEYKFIKLHTNVNGEIM